MNKKILMLTFVLALSLLTNGQVPNVTKSKVEPPHYSGVEMYGKWNGNISAWIPVYQLITLYPSTGKKHLYTYNNQGLYLECGTYKYNNTFDTLSVVPNNILDCLGSDEPKTYVLQHDSGLFNEIHCRKFVRSKDSKYLIELVPDVGKSLELIDQITESMSQKGDTMGLNKAIEWVHRNPLTRRDTL